MPGKKNANYPKSRKPIFLLIVEGRNQTETLYFRHFNTRNARYILKVISAEDTDPMRMAKKADGYYRKFEMSAGLGDRAYCLVDLDLSMRKVEQTETAKKRYKNVEFVLSNPCFEIWLLYYFTEYPPAVSSSQKVKDLMRKFVPEYTESLDIVEYKRLGDKLPFAIDNALKRQSFYNGENLAERNPYTEVVDLIIKLIKPEI